MYEHAMLRLRYALAAMACLAVLSRPATARAWRDEGHAVVCEIALRELTSEARRKVEALVEGDPEYRTFADSCGWPDHPRTRTIEHYVNLRRTDRHITSPACPLASACVLSAIEKDSAIVRDPASTAAERLTALKYLGHWVGDVHQPLHVSYADDRGGNSIATTGSCAGDLHAVWDWCLVLEQLDGSTPLQHADALRRTVTAAERATWTASGPVVWADETYQITIAPPTGYCVQKSGACRYDNDRITLDDQPRKSVTIDQAYVAANGPMVDLQLKKAGVRLGALLNHLLASQD